MIKVSKENGITLVALIITIIVLLILAVVTISAVNEGSLFAHANNAAKSYSESQEKENTMISNYLTELGKHDKTNNSSGPITWASLGITDVTLNTIYTVEDNGYQVDVILEEDSINGISFKVYFNGELENQLTNGQLAGTEPLPDITLTITTNKMEIVDGGENDILIFTSNTIEWTIIENGVTETYILTVAE